MAGNYITIGSKFQPFTYEELVRPYQKYGEAYREQEAIYSDAMDKTGIVGGKINDQREAETYKKYMDYQTELQQSADALTKGLNMGSRRNLMNVRKKYASEILPIAQLIEKRDQIAEEQRKGAIADNSIIYDKDYSVMSLDEMAKNPVNSYRAVSGMELAKQASHEATSLARAIITNPTYSTIVNGYLERGQMQGYTPEQIISAIANDKNAPPELINVINNVYERSGLSQFDLASQEKGRSYINKGLYDAIGQAKSEAVQDNYNMNEYQNKMYNLSKNQDAREQLQSQYYVDEMDEKKYGVLLDDGIHRAKWYNGKITLTNIKDKTVNPEIITEEEYTKRFGNPNSSNATTVDTEKKNDTIKSYASGANGTMVLRPGKQFDPINSEILVKKNKLKIGTTISLKDVAEKDQAEILRLIKDTGLDESYFTIKKSIETRGLSNDPVYIISPDLSKIYKEAQELIAKEADAQVASFQTKK